MIVERFGQLVDRFEVILVLFTHRRVDRNGAVVQRQDRANLGSPVVLVVHGRTAPFEQIRAAADSAIAELRPTTRTRSP
jgi:phosphate acetyltransferase